MRDVGGRAVAAHRVLATATGEQRNHALQSMAAALRAQQPQVLAANARDMAAAVDARLGKAALDRLALDPARVESMARGLEDIAALPDPIGAVVAEWTRPNGLRIQRVR